MRGIVQRRRRIAGSQPFHDRMIGRQALVRFSAHIGPADDLRVAVTAAQRD
jgi:hypothetical protein